MAFSARSFLTIAAEYLADLVARYADRGKPLNTATGSDDEMRASALALQIAPIEANAAAVSSEIVPSTASVVGLARWASLLAITRDPASAAVVLWRVLSTTPSTLLTFGSSVLAVAATGIAYAPNAASATTSAGTVEIGGTAYYYVDVPCTADTTGTDGNVSANTLATWSSAPAGAAPLAQAQSTTTPGVDEETLEAWRTRIISRMQERPASGNRADWDDWIRAVTAVEDVYVYPLLHSTLGTKTLGAVTVLPLLAVQGDSVTSSRIPNGAKLTQIKGYIEGTYTAAGAATTTGTQLRPVTIDSDDYFVLAASTVDQNIDVQLVLSSAYAFPWTGTMATDAASSTTSLVVTGDQTAKNGKAALVYVGTDDIRGGYQVVTLPTGVFATGVTTFDLTATPLNGVPGGNVYPAPPNWAALRTAIFALFDALGPGDTSPACRWPSEETRGRSTLYPSSIISALMAVTGVLSVTVVAPAASYSPAAKTIVALGTFLVRTA